MEKIKISISGRDFNLKSEDPKRLRTVAAELDKKIDKTKSAMTSLSLTDAIILTALDYADSSYDTKNAVERALAAGNELKEKLEAVTKEKEAIQNQLNSSISETAQLKISLSEAQNELSGIKQQIAKIDFTENETLKQENADLKERLEAVKEKTASMEQAWSRLKEDFQKSQDKSANKQKQEIEQLKNTVATYEKAFDEYAEQKKAEVNALNEEIIALRKKNVDLTSRLNEITIDGQMTL